MRLNARRYPDKVAVRDQSRSLTYRELFERATAAGAALSELGTETGSNVGILAGNSVWCAESYLAVLAAGATPVMYNWRWATPELVFALNDSQVGTVLVDSEHERPLAVALESGSVAAPPRVVREGADFDSLIGQGYSIVPDSDLSAANVIIYTGGTTGFPKGVVLSERTIMTNALNEIIDTDMEHCDTTLLIAPMYHAASLLCWFVPHIVLGATSYLVNRFDEQQVGAIVEQCEVTNGFLVPNMVRRLIAAGTFDKFDWSSYRRMYVGGATFRMPDKIEIKKALPDVKIYYQYGLSEGGPIVTRLRPEDIFREDVDGSIGQEFLFAEVQVHDVVTRQPVAAGVVGELVVRGNVMDGYFGRPVETADVLPPDGWLRTGDLVSRDAAGFFFYHDRSKDMIKSGGENVYSAEVERVLYAHPAVMEAAVFGRKSDAWDEEVCAVIALKVDCATTAAELIEWCRRSLAGYKVPRKIAFLNPGDMPVNESGKLIKRDLRTMEIF
ncbi:MAG TPA: class I adenylate-forming enzyme family protein [Gemmatimonadaceae bacterium]|nr:class I adenylate-forming enzyme family protein [Gemmatimonadaceae bacterium]